MTTRSTPARWLAVLVAALAAAGCLATAGCGGGDSRSSTVVFPVKDRKAAPAVTGTTLEGAPYTLADQRGTVVVLNFWATWCAPCVREATALEATYTSTRQMGVAFLGVNVHDVKDKALAFQSGRLTYPSLFDPPSRVALEFPDLAVTIPSTVVIDRDGRVAAAVRTSVTQDGLTALVRQIAAEP